MQEKVYYISDDVMKVMQNAMDIVETNGIERSTPIVIFKGIMDLETSPLYDYIMGNTFRDNEELEGFFEEAFSILISPKKKGSKKKSVAAEDTEQKEDEGYSFFDNVTGKKLLYTEEVAIMLSRAIQITVEKKSEELKLDYIIAAIAEKIPKDILKFLRNMEVDVNSFKNYFTKPVNSKEDILPLELKSFMTVLNDQYEKNTRCPILGRDKECDIVWKTMQKKTKRNVILIGEPGVGKSSIAKKIAHDIVNGNCPETFKNCIVISVNVNAAIAGTQYRGDSEERFMNMIDFLEKTDNIILFIDEIHTILGAGACREGEMDLANALKPILAEGKVRVIGATTLEEYERYFTRDGALSRRFRSVEVNEPTSKEVYPMLKNAISDLSKYHGVKITKAMVEYVVLISSCFNHTTSNPDRTIDLVDLSMVEARSDGKAVVDKESVLKNFDIQFEKYEKMDYEAKKSTAYHEVGHYLVWKFSEYLKDMEAIAISIMPAQDYLGITIFDELDNEVTVSGDMNYYIDYIAMYLAGRIAEKIYTNTISSGAASDLNMATKKAYSLVVRYGMVEDFGKNRVYFDSENYTMTSEKVVNNVNTEIDKLIAKAYTRAEQILKENEFYLKKLVNQLMEKGILSKRDLDKIFAEKPKSAKKRISG